MTWTTVARMHLERQTDTRRELYMQNVERAESSTDNNAPRLWWIPFPISVLLTPLMVGISVMSFGYGHGDAWANNFLFPLYKPLTALLQNSLFAERIVYLLQFPLYGVLVSVGVRFKSALRTTCVIVLVHCILCWTRDSLVDLIYFLGAAGLR